MLPAVPPATRCNAPVACTLTVFNKTKPVAVFPCASVAVTFTNSRLSIVMPPAKESVPAAVKVLAVTAPEAAFVQVTAPDNPAEAGNSEFKSSESPLGLLAKSAKTVVVKLAGFSPMLM